MPDPVAKRPVPPQGRAQAAAFGGAGGGAGDVCLTWMSGWGLRRAPSLELAASCRDYVSAQHVAGVCRGGLRVHGRTSSVARAADPHGLSGGWEARATRRRGRCVSWGGRAGWEEGGRGRWGGRRRARARIGSLTAEGARRPAHTTRPGRWPGAGRARTGCTRVQGPQAAPPCGAGPARPRVPGDAGKRRTQTLRRDRHLLVGPAFLIAGRPSPRATLAQRPSVRRFRRSMQPPCIHQCPPGKAQQTTLPCPPACHHHCARPHHHLRLIHRALWAHAPQAAALTPPPPSPVCTAHIPPPNKALFTATRRKPCLRSCPHTIPHMPHCPKLSPGWPVCSPACPGAATDAHPTL